MAKRKRNQHLAEERRSEETYLLAKRLVRLRVQRKNIGYPENVDIEPTAAQKAKLLSIKTAIQKTKDVLVKRGVSPVMISNNTKLVALLNSTKTRPVAKRRSANVGMYTLGNSLKYWKS